MQTVTTLIWLSGILLLLALVIMLIDQTGEPLRRRWLLLSTAAGVLGLDGLTFAFCVWMIRTFA